jgi:hypothetical protein
MLVQQMALGADGILIVRRSRGALNCNVTARRNNIMWTIELCFAI